MGESIGEDVELRLGLSIGGGFMQPHDEKKGGNDFFCGRRSEAETCGERKEEAEELLEQRRRKELHALRRQAARRKREEKREAMKARDGKRTRGGEEMGEGAAAGRGGRIKREGCTPSGFSTVPMMQYVVQNGDKVQYIPVAPGCSFPFVVPCWPASSSSPVLAPTSDTTAAVGRSESDALFFPVPYRSFTSEGAAGASASMRPGPPSSSVSGGCSSSAASDSKSGGRSTGESRSQSHSSNPPSQQLRQGSFSSQARLEAVDNGDGNATAAQLNRSPAPVNCERIAADCNEKPRGRPMPAMREEREKGPKAPSLPQMPCVSTTGDGPNGKTITGFLYRYTKSEVSIMCVCHGASFSPAEFIRHAGGTDTAHPLRHINVVLSSAD